MKIKGLKCIFWSLIVMMAGCSKNYITIYESDPSSGTDGNNQNPDNTNLITFHASIESRNMTRSMSPIEKGVEAKLFAYDGVKGTETLVETGYYTSSSPGTLTGVLGYKMYLSNGKYDFYGVSDHTSVYLTTFSNGKSEPLFNGIDYLWWNAVAVDVSSSQVSVPIVFLHSATQVVVEVDAGVGLTLNKLVSATITPPEFGAQMNFFTGVIPPTSTYSSPDKMGINGSLAQYIMLPLATTKPMTLVLEVQVNGESNTRDYEVEIPVPDGELKAGNSYLFRAVINENTVDFNTVGIKDWTEVDETGAPLYPTQK